MGERGVTIDSATLNQGIAKYLSLIENNALRGRALANWY